MTDNTADTNSTKALSNAIARMMIEIDFAETKRIQNFLSFLFLTNTVTVALLNIFAQKNLLLEYVPGMFFIAYHRNIVKRLRKKIVLGGTDNGHPS